MRILTIPILATVASCSSAPPTEDSRVLRDDWIPALEQIADDYEERYDAAQGQHFSAACQESSRDAQMLVAYVHLWQWLDAGGRTTLRQEQDDWDRSAHEEARIAGKEFEGGSLESQVSARTYAKLARKRTQELRSRLKALRGPAYVDPVNR